MSAPLSGNHSAGALGKPLLHACVVEAIANTGWLAIRRIDDCNVGDVQRRLLTNDPAGGSLCWLLMLGGQIGALNNHTALRAQDLRDFAAPIFITEGVHRQEYIDITKLDVLLTKYKVKTNFFQKELTW